MSLQSQEPDNVPPDVEDMWNTAAEQLIVAIESLGILASACGRYSALSAW